jgi:putative redox protein
MKASVTLRHGPDDRGISLSGTADSGFRVDLAGSGGEGLRPMELLLISLAGCTALDVISILQKQRQDVTGLQVHVAGERATEHPRVFTDIQVHFLISGRDVNPKAVERAIALSRDKYCSVSAMLNKTAAIECSYEIVTCDMTGDHDDPNPLPMGRH